jgi:hypothetical protein
MEDFSLEENEDEEHSLEGNGEEKDPTQGFPHGMFFFSFHSLLH